MTLRHQLMTFFKNGRIWRETSSNFEFERQQLKTVASQLQIDMLEIYAACVLTIVDARFRSCIEKINVNDNTTNLALFFFRSKHAMARVNRFSPEKLKKISFSTVTMANRARLPQKCVNMLIQVCSIQP